MFVGFIGAADEQDWRVAFFVRFRILLVRTVSSSGGLKNFSTEYLLPRLNLQIRGKADNPQSSVLAIFGQVISHLAQQRQTRR